MDIDAIASIRVLAASKMEEYSFYKSLYDREINRRKDLDSLINIPIGIISLLTGLIYFLVKNHPFENGNYIDCMMIILILMSSILVLVSLIFIAKSYNNFFMGFSYLNFPLISSIRTYQMQLIEYNKEVESEERKDFKTEIINKLTEYTDSHVRINDQRSLDLYKAKVMIVLTMFILILGICLFSFKRYLI